MLKKQDRYRSNFESRLAQTLTAKEVPFIYESTSIVYQSTHKYIPDFVLPSGLILEAKGYFPPQDRRKHLLIKKQYPELKIRFVFQDASRPINKGSKTTYALWCQKHGFTYFEGNTLSGLSLLTTETST